VAGERVERRLAAILAADVAGYSRLMGADEVGTLAALKAHRREIVDPAIAAHRGRIVKTTGDGILVEFASAVDAVTCAIAVQQRMAERTADRTEPHIQFRVGINIGDIIIDDDDIFGDGVNVAARVENECEPGGVCLSGSAFEQIRGKTSFTFDDLGDKSLKNIDRPVRLYAARLAGAMSPTSASADAEATRPLPLPDKPSIAVLPFTNMSGDPEQEYFADGMVDEIITGLSRIKWLFVIARNSSFIYKGKPVDVRQVGRELGVRYVLEGGVRKSGNRIRVTAQLLEAANGAHLWADRFDGALEDVFDLQDQITEKVVGIVEPSLRQSEIERSRRKRPDSLGAYDLYLRALPHFASDMPEDAKIGMEFLEEALKIDANYASAHAYLAWGLEMRVVRGGFNVVDAEAGARHARAALDHGGDDATALGIASFAILHLGHDFAAASGAIARALSLNGSCAIALYFGAHVHSLSGDPTKAEDYALRALRLSPFDPLCFVAHFALGNVRFREGRYDDAASSYAEGVGANPRFSTLYALQAAALGMAGRIDATKPISRRLFELEPTFRIEPFITFFTAFAAPEIVNNWPVGMRNAGLPE
jgi:adenylate cyclase